MERYGLTKERYEQLLGLYVNEEKIEEVVQEWGVETCNKGYAIFDFDQTGMLEVNKIDVLGVFEDDAAAVEQAIKDGVKIIPVEELPADFAYKHLGWVDTPSNRKLIREFPCKTRLDSKGSANKSFWDFTKINFDEKHDDYEEGFTHYYFIAPKEFLNDKYPEAEAMEISLTFPTDNFEPNHAYVEISPTKYVVDENSYIDYDWSPVALTDDEKEELYYIAVDTMIELETKQAMMGKKCSVGEKPSSAQEGVPPSPSSFWFFTTTILMVILIALATALNKYERDHKAEIEEKQTYIEQLELQNKELTKIIDELKGKPISWNPCPLCDETPVLFQVKDSFYLECENCGLQTGYFTSKDGLSGYWNYGEELPK